jgi:PAS domain S-box-containing protein
MPSPDAFDALVLRHNPDAVVVVDAAGAVRHWNAAAEVLFGYAVDEALGCPLAALVGGVEAEGLLARSLERARSDGVNAEETLLCRKDGQQLVVGSTTRPMTGPDGGPHLLLTLRDVTALKAQRETRLIEARYRDLLEHTPDAILIVNGSGRIVLANAMAQQVFGHGRAALVGQPVEILLPRRYQQAHLGRRSGFFAQPRTRSMGAGLELFGLRADGEEFPVEISLSPLQTDEGPMVMCAVRDVTDRQEARRRSDRQFRDLLESAPDAMVIADEAGRIVLVNSQTQRLFGWPRDELLGQAVETLVPHRFRQGHATHRQGFFGAPKLRQMGAGLQLYGLRRDGSEFPVEISLSPIQTEGGLLIASAIRDASERKQTEQLLQQANRLKSEFLANMSHELRTPLNGILGFSELLVDERIGPLNAKQREYIHDIHECGKHLLQLINDVLDLSKVEAGKMSLHAETFAPVALVGTVFNVILPLARKKRITLHPPTGAEALQVHLDTQMVRQILFNLLSNAVKFTEPGGQVEVRIATLEPDAWQLAVQDTGVGIAETDQGRLFQAFSQLDGGLSRRHEGTGLGLALTRKLVELQGGSIAVESTRGVGSTFTVRLPLRLSPQPPQA